MIGKAQWFTRRKYGGWGLAPKTWQAWVYIAAMVTPFIIFQALPIWDIKTRIIATVIWLGILLLDTIDIMIHLKKDEREQIHEAMAERNAAWVMVAVITIGILYQAFSSALNETLKLDPFLIAALIGGLLAKAITNVYLDKKN